VFQGVWLQESLNGHKEIKIKCIFLSSHSKLKSNLKGTDSHIDKLNFELLIINRTLRIFLRELVGHYLMAFFITAETHKNGNISEGFSSLYIFFAV
jgi:hypothetical protein